LAAHPLLSNARFRHHPSDCLKMEKDMLTQLVPPAQRLHITVLASAAASFACPFPAHANLQISIGLRETMINVPGTIPIGGNGGTIGGIEWANLDGQTLTLDNTWQQFSFNLSTATYNAFVGGNGVLEGAGGVLEHIRVRNSGGHTAPLTLWIDSVQVVFDLPGPPPPQTTVFGSFEGFASNTQVMFIEPGFSGSTSAFLAPAPDFAGVDNSVAHDGSASYRTEFAFINSATTNWLRLTTFNADNSPNPAIPFAAATVSFWMKGVPEPATLSLLGLALVRGSRRRRAR
jgi:hypothetical protein